MAGSKFELNIMQNLEAIEKMVKDGATDKDIAEHLGVSRQAFTGYLKQGKEAKEKFDNAEKLNADEKNFFVFFNTYAHARKAPDEIVEASLLKSCQDRTIDKTITIKRYDAEGTLMWIEEKVEKVPVAASVPAQQFYLANKKRKDWEYKPDAKGDDKDAGETEAIIITQQAPEPKRTKK